MGVPEGTWGDDLRGWLACDRCGAVKRNVDGQTLMTSLKWRLTRRMVCPPCFETEKTMEALDNVVNWDSDEVPF